MDRCKFRVIPACIIVLVVAAGLCAQDPGVADTVRIGSDSATVVQKASIPVYLFNDEAVLSVTIPLLIDGYSGWATFDSVSYVGSRLASAAILDVRQVQVVETDTFSVEKLIVRFEVGGGSNLPAGSGKLCELWFRPWFGGTVALDTSGNSTASELELVDGSSNVISPVFESGTIQFACDYMIADIDQNNVVTISDLIAMHKVLFWHESPYWYDPLAVFDLNGDRHTDLKDEAYLLDMVFFGSAPPVPCGNHNQATYDDPGVTDTLSVKSDTMYVGGSQWLEFALANDDSIRSFAFAFEWDGTGTMERTISESSHNFDSISGRLQIASGTLGDGYGYGSYDDGVNPDTFHLCYLPFDQKPVVREGSGPIFYSRFKGLTPGTVTFRLMSHYGENASGPIDKLVPGPESMLLGYEQNAIIPVFVSGVITILPLCGDADGSGIITISDAVFLINYIFAGGTAPYDIAAGDADCNGVISISDAVYLINFIFGGGAAPCAACP